MASSERMKQYELVFKLGKGDRVPTEKEMGEIALICMGELVLTTGLRPCAVYRMPKLAYLNKDEGYNPYFYTDEDETEEEPCEDDVEKRLRRRTDPRLPPLRLA